MEVVINIIYSVSPRHTDEYYAQKAREAAAIKPYRICFKDVGGLLTPERTRTLFPLIKKNIGDLTLEFHAHCNNGMAPFNYLEALKLGANTLHTAIPPLADGSSQPSIFNIASNAQSLGYKPLVDLAAIKPVEKHFTFIAKREGHPIAGSPKEYLSVTQPLVRLVGELSKRSDFSRVYIRKNGLMLRMEKRQK